MEIVRAEKPLPLNMRIVDIPVGTVFEAKVPGDVGSMVFLAAYGCVVDLSNPKRTWSGCTVFENYRVVRAKLVVDGYAD